MRLHLPLRSPRRFLLAVTRLARTAGVIGACTLASHLQLPAQCPSQWLPGDGFDLRGGASTDNVLALAQMPNGDVIAGGQFPVAGGIAVDNIARWNGSTWSPLGAGLQGGPVRALAVLPNGDLVAGGEFTSAGGIAVSKLARWDGSAWSDLGGGVTGGNGLVRSLAVTAAGALLVGGSFSAAGTVVADSVALWNGSGWSAYASFGGGILVNYTVNALALLPNGNLVVAIEPNGGGYGVVKEWAGTNWTNLGTTTSGFGIGGYVSTLAVLPSGDLVAGGYFQSIGLGNSLDSIARWNGSTWSALDTASPTGLMSYTIPGRAVAMTVLANGDLLVGGDFTTAGGVPASNIARWSNGTWSNTGDIDGSVRSLLALANGEVIASGSFNTANGLDARGIARWGCDAGIAKSVAFGAGCYSRAESFYESFPAAPTLHAFDLSMSTLHMARNANGYDVTWVSGPPAWFAPLGTDLGLGDDSHYTAPPLPFTISYPGGSTNQLIVGSNGYVFLQPSSVTGPYYGYTAGLLSDAPRLAAMWGDQDPATGTGAGTVKYDVDVATQRVYVTWEGIQQWNAPGVVSTFQIAIAANGDVDYRYQTCIHQAQTLAGWSPGGNSQDPGSIDLSTATPFSTGSPFATPPRHTADHRPLLGTSVTLTTDNLPASSLLGLTVVGFTEYSPGIELSSIGMPGCYLFVALDLLYPFFPVAQSGNLTIAVPNQASLIGFPLHSQGTAWDFTANPFGMLTSNAMTLVVGNP